MIDKIRQLSLMIKNSAKILVFTGAGISTESGISDYRSKGGLWNRFTPVTIQEFEASLEKRQEYWVTKMELYASMKTAKPNEGHYAIKEIEKLNKLRGLITQNIDGLHTAAGSQADHIIEIHGSNRQTICLSCTKKISWEDTYARLLDGEKAPECLDCGGLLKPDTVSFGQSLDQRKLQTAFNWADDCDMVLSVGSTLVVEPAASIPRLAQQQGAKLVIISLSDTPLDAKADLKIEKPAGQVLKGALNLINE